VGISLVLAALAAAPSLAWAARGADLLTDDYGHLLVYRDTGAAGALWSWATENPARPVAALYHLLTYGLVGDRPALQALVLAIVNGACAAAIWGWGRRWGAPHLSLGAALLFAVAPNRTASRYWVATGNYVLAPLLALVGYHLLRDKQRPWLAALAFTAAILTLEAVIGLVLAMLVAWVVVDPRERWTAATLVLLPGVLAALVVTAMSPKVGVHDFDIVLSLQTLPYGLFGVGLWGDLAPLGLVLLAVAFVIGLAGALPSFGVVLDRTRDLRVALGVIALTMAPFVLTARFFSGRGFFDRSNTIPLVVIGALFAALVDLVDTRARRLLLGPVAAAAVAVYSLNLGGLEDYRAAAAEGRTVTERLVADVPAGGGTVVVVPPGEYHSGAVAFVYPGDLAAAMRLRHPAFGPVLMPSSEAACIAMTHGEGDVSLYDWRRRSTVSPTRDGCAAADS
jgi:hypothetical protein